MSDGTCCHHCRQYECMCLSSSGIKMLKVILELCQDYNNANPQVGINWGADVEIAKKRLEKVGIRVCEADFRLAKGA